MVMKSRGNPKTLCKLVVIYEYIPFKGLKKLYFDPNIPIEEEEDGLQE